MQPPPHFDLQHRATHLIAPRGTTAIEIHVVLCVVVALVGDDEEERNSQRNLISI